MAAFDEEIFGPVAPITTFKTDVEAIALANATEYGLVAAVVSTTSQGLSALPTNFTLASSTSTTKRSCTVSTAQSAVLVSLATASATAR